MTRYDYEWRISHVEFLLRNYTYDEFGQLIDSEIINFTVVCYGQQFKKTVKLIFEEK